MADDTPLEVMLSGARAALASWLGKLHAYVGEASSASLRWSGLMGLLAFVFAYYQWRGERQAAGEQQAIDRTHSSHGSSTAPPSVNQRSATPSPAAQAPTPPAPAVPAAPKSAAEQIRLVLGPARKCTLATLGVLLEEESVEELAHSCTVKPGAVEVVKNLGSVVDLYLITQVGEDDQEGRVRAALAAAGLVGAAGPVREHKLLFCSTSQGRESMVRQLEPDIHVDASSTTVDNMARFVPMFLHVCRAGTQPAKRAPNVAISVSLNSYFCFS